MPNHAVATTPFAPVEPMAEAAGGWTRHRELVWSSTRRIGERLVDLLDPQSGERLLELAAGPGDTGLLAAARLGSRGRLLATDADPHAVETIRRRASGFGLTNVAVAALDAHDTGLPPRSLDGILFRFGLMLCDDPVRVLAECRRLLRPGGRLALAVWTARPQNPWGTVVPDALSDLGLAARPDERAPGAFALSDPALLSKLLRDASLDVRSEECAGVLWRYRSFETFWQTASQMSRVLIETLPRLSERETTALRERVRAACLPYLSSDGLALPGVAHLVLVARPPA